MVYLKRFTFKLGINPSQAAQFNYSNLSPVQKLTLARCRIFQTTLNSQHATGVNAIRPSYENMLKAASYSVPVHVVI